MKLAAVMGSPGRITLTCLDGTDDPHPCRPGDDVMQPQVHLHRRLLHMLDVGRGEFDKPFALAHVCAEGGDLRVWPETPETPSQEAVM